jgi:hypothetical protein
MLPDYPKKAGGSFLTAKIWMAGKWLAPAAGMLKTA